MGERKKENENKEGRKEGKTSLICRLELSCKVILHRAIQQAFANSAGCIQAQIIPRPTTLSLCEDS
jgi:hypothetical protein